MRRRAFLAALPLLFVTRAWAAPPPPSGGGAGRPSFMRLPVINANVLRANRTRGVMSLESGLDVPDAKLRARVELLVPRLRSDLSQRLAAYTANLPAGAAPNLDLLTPLLQKQVDVTAGQPGARLLIMNVLIN
ncbi:MAG: hypothetical protein ACKODL_10975 [Phenylobacterium sp.]